MTIKDGWELFNYNTGMVSELVRHSAFVGLGVVAYFLKDRQATKAFKYVVVFSAICFILALILDLLQYSMTAGKLHAVIREKDRANIGLNEEFRVSASLYNWSGLLWHVKIVSLSAGYVVLMGGIVSWIRRKEK